MKKIFNNIYNKYILCFFFMSIILFSPFWYYNRTLIWKTDGILTHYPVFVYYSRYLKDVIKNILNGNFDIPLFSFQLEAGADIIHILHTHILGDPFALLAVLFSNEMLPYGYSFIIILRLFTSGLVFCILGNYLKFNKNAILLGSLIYCFCGFALYASIRHPYFINPMVFLPLLILGIEKIIREQKYICFLISFALAGISSFYFFYMLVLFLIIYTIGRLLYIKGKDNKLSFFRNTFITACLGSGIASIILIPMIVFVLDNSRTSGYEMYAIFYYDLKHYLLLINEFFIGFKDAGFWSILHFPIIIFFAILTIFKYKEFNYLKIIFLIGTIILCVPLLGYVWSGCSYISNRNIWCYAFILAFIFMATYEKLKIEIVNKHKYFLYGTIGLILCFICEISLYFILYEKFSLSSYILINGILNVILVSFTYYILKNSEWVIAFFICINIIFNGLYLYSNLGSNYADQFLTVNDLNERIVLENNMVDNIFYRLYINDNNNDLLNNAIREQYNSLTASYTLNSKSFVDFYKEMNLPRRSLVFDGLDNRTILSTVSDVLYIKNYDYDNRIPYGYEEVGNRLFKNQFLLPIAYSYDNYVVRNDNENPLIWEENMLDCIVLDNPIDFLPENLKQNKIEKVISKIDYDKNIKKKNNDIIISKKKNTVINISYQKSKFGEYYIYIPKLKNLNTYGNGSLNGIISFKSNNLEKEINIRSKNHGFYVENNGILINLGWQKDNENIDIIIKNKGKYEFAEPQILFLPLDNYEEKIAKLKENALQNINIGTNEITGDITVDKKKLLFFSVPYSKGWEAFVDGKKTDIYKANIMYMAIPLEAGNHHIELKYRTPYLDLGIGVSIVSLILSIIWIMYLKRKNKEIKNEEN